MFAQQGQQRTREADQPILNEVKLRYAPHADADQAHEGDFLLGVVHIQQRDHRYDHDVHEQDYRAQRVHDFAGSIHLLQHFAQHGGRIDAQERSVAAVGVQQAVIVVETLALYQNGADFALHVRFFFIFVRVALRMDGPHGFIVGEHYVVVGRAGRLENASHG